jgi:hypothetical protein
VPCTIEKGICREEGSEETREALIDEANQLTAIFVASHKTATGRAR